MRAGFARPTIWSRRQSARQASGGPEAARSHSARFARGTIDLPELVITGCWGRDRPLECRPTMASPRGIFDDVNSDLSRCRGEVCGSCRPRDYPTKPSGYCHRDRPTGGGSRGLGTPRPPPAGKGDSHRIWAICSARRDGCSARFAVIRHLWCRSPSLLFNDPDFRPSQTGPAVNRVTIPAASNPQRSSRELRRSQPCSGTARWLDATRSNFTRWSVSRTNTGCPSLALLVADDAA